MQADSAWASHALLETLVRHAPIGVAFVDLDFRFVLINDKLAAMNGLSPAEHVGRLVSEVVPDLWPILEPLYRRVVTTGHAVTDVEIVRPVGSSRDDPAMWLEGFYPVRDRHGRLEGIGVIAAELTQQRRAEAEHRAIVAAMPDFVFELSGDGTHLSFHAPHENQLYVRADLILGRRVRELMPETVADIYETVIARTLGTAQVQLFEYSLDYPDGARHFEGRMVRKDADKVLVVVRDITDRVEAEKDRQRLEEQFRQAQKMEAIGQLAGGVAHDFNNLLTIINGYAELALDALAPDAPVREAILEVQKAGERAGTLTRQLLLFTRQQVLEPRSLDLNGIVGATHSMLGRVIGEDVSLSVQLDPDLHAVRVDAGQIEQVLLNLAVNARDAMPTGGSLTIATANAVVDARASDPGGIPADYVRLTVRDTGTGMDAATKARIFEPFFTTKQPGKGTGLGLAVVFGVVRQSGGFIDVTTAPGEGTTFVLSFPRAAEPTERPVPDSSLQDMPGGTEVVLLVEDDASVRRMTRRILEKCGYVILEAGDGREAVDLITRHHGAIDLLVSDVVMPHFGGRQLAEMATRMHPDMRVLFLSGYTDDDMVRHGVQREELAFLQKPFTPSALAQKVRAVLDHGR